MENNEKEDRTVEVEDREGERGGGAMKERRWSIQRVWGRIGRNR